MYERNFFHKQGFSYLRSIKSIVFFLRGASLLYICYIGVDQVNTSQISTQKETDITPTFFVTQTFPIQS